MHLKLILLLAAQCFCIAFSKNLDHKRQKRDTIADKKRKWPGGVIPYRFEDNIDSQVRTLFIESKKEIENVSCVRFVERTNEKDYVRIITSKDGCYSKIGRTKGSQILAIGSTECHSKEIVLHQMLHTVGFLHEHSRRDRNKYIKIKHNNVLPGRKHFFKRMSFHYQNTLGQPYDPDSIMHFSNHAFSKNGRRTIVYKKDRSRKLGSSKMSPIDIKQLNLLYKCNKKTEKAPPRILSPITSIPEIVLNDIVINCSIEGAFPVKVMWFKDDKPLLKVYRRDGFQFSNQRTILKLKKLLPSDRGTYKCVVENAYGKIQHSVEVEPYEQTLAAPYIIVPTSKHQYANIGDDLDVTVEVVEFGRVHFQLIHHCNQTDPITKKVVAKLKVMTTPRDIKLIGPETQRKSSDRYRYRVTFKFRELKESDFSNYSIMAGNTFGYDLNHFSILKRL